MARAMMPARLTLHTVQCTAGLYAHINYAVLVMGCLDGRQRGLAASSAAHTPHSCAAQSSGVSRPTGSDARWCAANERQKLSP